MIHFTPFVEPLYGRFVSAYMSEGRAKAKRRQSEGRVR